MYGADWIAFSSEEHSPSDLVFNAQRAEEVGFQFALISVLSGAGAAQIRS
jgi:hypothetical protein